MKIQRRQFLATLGAVGCSTRASAIAPSAPQPPHPTAQPQPRALLPTEHRPPRLPLFERFPKLGERLPVAALGDWPTPLDAIGPFLVKRDDLSAEPYGGGKPRKLELFFGKALQEGKAGVVTFGGVGSHHAAATAIYAHQLGLACRLELLPQPATPEVRRVLLTCQRHGAEMVLAGSRAGERARPADHLVIPAGGTSPLGNVGFVNAALELADQLRDVPLPRALYIAVGTLGSAVGLAIGLALAELPIPIVGVRAASWEAASPQKMRTQLDATVAWLRERDPTFPALTPDPQRFRFENRYLGGGYAEPTPTGAAATARAKELGLRLDDTYTAKAFAALLDAERAPNAAAGGPLLFWHTHSHRPLSDEGDPDDLPPALRPFAGVSSAL